MKKNKIIIGIVCAIVVWTIIGAIDFAMVHGYHKPIFCVCSEPMQDGGSGKYVGLGYSFDIEGNFLSEVENPGVTSYRGYILGFEVSRGFWEEMLPGPEVIFSETKKGLTDVVLEEPPALTVLCGRESVEALRGTASWTYQNEDGIAIGVESDSMHPLQAKEYMSPLGLMPTTISAVDPRGAYLQWDISPDKVSVCCWSEEYWGLHDAESEEIAVDSWETDLVSGGQSTDYGIRLKDGNYIYQVTAKWNAAEKYGGTAYYSFYTVKPVMELQPIA